LADDRKIPEGRVGRFVRLAGLGARTSASLLFSKNGEGAAERAAEVLGTLRGVAAKVGQMASYVDGVVPEGQREAYEHALRKLREHAPTSTSADIRALVERELGAPIAELFQDWEDEPVASASIGQVHRARLPDGRVVAVKVQHSGIANAIESDLQNVGMLEAVIGSVVGKTFNSRGVLEEVKTRFREELDYRLEARRQREFAQIFQGDPQIFVPAVIAERSSTRVLTSEFVVGWGLDEAATRTESERRAYAEALWPRRRHVQRRSAPGQLRLSARWENRISRFRLRATDPRRANGTGACPAPRRGGARRRRLCRTGPSDHGNPRRAI